MKNIRLITRTFVSQSAEKDCGLACLQMIFGYAHRGRASLKNHVTVVSLDRELSLLDLRDIAKEAGLTARCVEMEIGFLRMITQPCILHVKNRDNADHYIVCYGEGKGEFAGQLLIADPAESLSFITMERLSDIWQSRAALYFEHLSMVGLSRRFLPAKGIFGLGVFPKELAFAITLLGLTIAFLSIPVSWVLQKGLDDSITSGSRRYLLALLILLLLVTLIRCLLTYLRNYILLILNTSINKALTLRLISVASVDTISLPGSELIKQGLLEISKIQHAVSEMSAVVFTDGLLLLTLLAAISETMPLCGIYNIVYMAIAFGINWRRLPYQLIRHSAFEALALRAESGLTKSAVHGDSGSITQYMDYLTQLGDIGKKNGLHQLIIDIAGSLNVMLIMAYGIVMLKQMALSYPAFMAVVLASYFITILTPRICNSMQVIYDGSIILSRKAATYQK